MSGVARPLGPFVHFLELGPREETLAEGMRTIYIYLFILGLNSRLFREESIYVFLQIQEHLAMPFSSQYLPDVSGDH